MKDKYFELNMNASTLYYPDKDFIISNDKVQNGSNFYNKRNNKLKAKKKK